MSLGSAPKNSKIRRALFTVSDKDGIVELAAAMAELGTEIVATGRTASVLKDAGLKVRPIEEVSGSPEAFQGRMKTLSFPVCSGILYRRADASDEQDLKKLDILPIDCVVVNFYPFEKAAARAGISQKELIEEIDIGGPTLVRAAAKNVPDVLVLTSPAQYPAVIADLKKHHAISAELAHQCAKQAWRRIADYDRAIDEKMNGPDHLLGLRYGENPHQTARLEFETSSPIAWEEKLTPNELSYNNILDFTSAYALASDLQAMCPGGSGVVIVKHNNPCGVALVKSEVSRGSKSRQLVALEKAWEGDPVSAFGGVICFTHALEPDSAAFLADRFVELIGSPGLNASQTHPILLKRKKLKAVQIRRLGEMPAQTTVQIPGGKLIQTADLTREDGFRGVTRSQFGQGREELARFGIFVTRTLKSNAVALVREWRSESTSESYGGYQLVGAGQGQPNRIEALKQLAIPRAISTLGGGSLGECILVSDAFFPFRDTVDEAARAGIKFIVQPGGSIKDQESIDACNEHGVAMAFTGVRHFKH